MVTTIHNKELRKALEKEGMADLTLLRGDGYFYWTSDTNEDLSLALLDVPTIPVCWYCQQNLDSWLRDAQEAFKAAKATLALWKEWEKEEQA